MADCDIGIQVILAEQGEKDDDVCDKWIPWSVGQEVLLLPGRPQDRGQLDLVPGDGEGRDQPVLCPVARGGPAAVGQVRVLPHPHRRITHLHRREHRTAPGVNIIIKDLDGTFEEAKIATSQLQNGAKYPVSIRFFPHFISGPTREFVDWFSSGSL